MKRHDVAWISDVLGRVRKGGAALVVLAGDPGVGKTTMMGSTARKARRYGFLVGMAKGARSDVGGVFGVVRRAVGDILSDCDVRERADLLEWAGDPAQRASRENANETEVYQALRELIEAVATRRPVLLAIDDAHLIPVSTLRFLAGLPQLLPSTKILIVLCARDREPVFEDAVIQEKFATAYRIRLRPWDSSRVAQVVHRSIGADVDVGVLRACGMVTGGNPFLLHCLLREIELRTRDLEWAISTEEIHQLGSPVVMERLRIWLNQCSDAVKLARAIAVLADGADLGWAASLARLEPDAASNAVDSLVRCGILANRQPLTFVHELVRNSVLQDIPVGTRSSSHVRAAQLLRTAGAPVNRVARQLLQAGAVRVPWAVATFRGAAQHALLHCAPDVAATYLRCALGQVQTAEERDGVLFELDSVEQANDPERCVSSLRTLSSTDVAATYAANALPESGATRLVALSHLIRRHTWRGDSRHRVVTWTRELLAGQDLSLFCPPHHFTALAMIGGDDIDGVRGLCQTVAATARTEGFRRVQAMALLVHGVADHAVGDLAGARFRLTSALEIIDDWHRSSSTGDTALCAAELAAVCVSAGDLQQAWRLFTERELLAELPDSAHSAFVLFARGRLKAASGDMDDAAADFEECGRRADGWGLRNPAVLAWRSQAALAHLAVGRMRRASDLAERELVAARQWGARRAIDVALHSVRLVSPDTWRSTEKLTKQERRAARLAAEGHSNKEIAQMFGVTVRCVEQHLSAVYRKLGVLGRSQLADVLRRDVHPDQ